MKNKLVAALVSLIVAFGLWLYVITVNNPESTSTFYDIPVVLQNDTALTERGLMVTTQDVPTVTLKLSGSRTDLNKLNKANITLMADLSKIYEAGEQQLSYQIYYPGDIPSNAFTIESQSPRWITLDIERRISKEVPVNVVFTGQISEGFMADTQNPVLDHPTVTITGPSPVIEQIAQARIEVDLTGRVESISESLRFDLCDAQGEKIDVAQVSADIGEVNLAVKIQRIKQIPLKVTVIAGGGATEATSDIQIEPSTILVSGSDTVLENLTEINLGTVNLGDLLGDVVDRAFPIKLPEGVANLTNVTEAKVSIRFPELKTLTLKVTDIRIENIPEGMEPEVVTKELQVTVRGPKELMDALKEANLYVTVDLTGASMGASTVKASVVFEEGFAGVGAIGSYSVSVNLKRTGE